MWLEPLVSKRDVGDLNHPFAALGRIAALEGGHDDGLGVGAELTPASFGSSSVSGSSTPRVFQKARSPRRRECLGPGVLRRSSRDTRGRLDAPAWRYVTDSKSRLPPAGEPLAQPGPAAC